MTVKWMTEGGGEGRGCESAVRVPEFGVRGSVLAAKLAGVMERTAAVALIRPAATFSLGPGEGHRATLRVMSVWVRRSRLGQIPACVALRRGRGGSR